MKIRDVWFKFFMDDWFIKTRHMTLELRGAYHEAICLIMKYEAPLPNDYRWIGHSMHVSERKAKAVIEELIAIGKLKRDENGISNDRCEREIAERVAQRAAATAAALARHRPEVEPELGQSRPEIGNGKKAEQKQQKQPKSALPRVRATDSDSEGEKKKDSPHPPNGGAPPSGLSAEQMEANRQLTLNVEHEMKRAKKPRPTRAAVAAGYAQQLRDLYDRARERVPLCETTWTEARDKRHIRRVKAIGGIENYRRALWAIKDDDYFSGRKTGRRMSFDILMAEDGKMGDVLARLLDIAAMPKTAHIQPINGKTWGWWRKDFDPSTIDAAMWRGAVKSTAFQSATEWPWWIAGPQMGHDECFIPPEIVTEFKLDQKFGESGNA